jgi:hypothetical protein
MCVKLTPLSETVREQRTEGHFWARHAVSNEDTEKTDNEPFRNEYVSRNIIKMVTSWRKRWAGYIALMIYIYRVYINSSNTLHNLLYFMYTLYKKTRTFRRKASKGKQRLGDLGIIQLNSLFIYVLT